MDRRLSICVVMVLAFACGDGGGDTNDSGGVTDASVDIGGVEQDVIAPSDVFADASTGPTVHSVTSATPMVAGSVITSTPLHALGGPSNSLPLISDVHFSEQGQAEQDQ